ncbi:phospholipid-binding protein MlaC [Candidatus Thiodubiliella endoseptemdiera]|uniref:ABC transporter substrate-binding protein n=1 Tax=Candidatus Thiodubiliella endoseptemdiera TaxID=2738886 RepID=A0A853F0S3_9GAMM|nr:ABC transporter substrate-binding protein [Candidatus Thiodubiliella endoseptemdiera]
MVKTSLIILSILVANTTLATDNHSKILTDIIDPPNTAALNVVVGALSSLKELRKKEQATPKNINALINIKLLPNIALDVATHLTLKKHWDNINDVQKNIFQRYIAQSLIRDYAGILGSYDQLESVNISVNPNVKRKDNKAIVKLIISFNKKQNPVKVTLKMIRLNHWYIYDLMFSGVSLIKNYQAQFDSHIKRKGLDSLIKKISRKLNV